MHDNSSKPSTDGRHRRSEQSRDKIVAAMLALIEEGAITPSAEAVATRAGVGLRSVFRRFKDMESLYHEITVRLSRSYDLWEQPYAASDWRGKLGETIERRLSAFERLLPFRRAANAHRHESPMIQAEHDRILAMTRKQLVSILPPEIGTDREKFETLDFLLSVDAWQRLRDIQKLDVETARTIIHAQVEALIARK